MTSLVEAGVRRSTTVIALVVCLAAGACAANPTSTWVGSDCGASPNLGPGASLFGCNLTGLDLSNLNLSGADLRGAVLVNANLAGSDLSGANLEGANLTGANLTGANLTGAILAGAILLGALFIGANLAGVNFDFGLVYGASGNGGGRPSGNSCVGAYCPGYNGTTVDNGHPLCSSQVGASFGEWFYVHQTEADLQTSGRRSVVIDSATSFHGATFDYSNQTLPSIVTLRGMKWSDADFSDATFINVGFGCQQATNARFSGATFTSTAVGVDASHWYVVDFKNSDFSGTTWTGVVMSDVDFSGSDFSNATISNWSLENQLDFNDDGQPDNDYPSPYHLLRLDNTNWNGARIGMDVNPGTGNDAVILSGTFNNTPFKSVSLAGADLSNSEIGYVVMSGANLTGITTNNTVIHGPGFFGGSDFSGGWVGATWTSPSVYYDFSAATCPDTSIYDPITPCLG